MKERKRLERNLPIMIIVGLFSFMTFLDTSIVNMAVPDIAQQLNISNAKTEQIVYVYTMILCLFCLVVGRIADKLGKYLVFKLGCCLFLLGSFLCGLITDFNYLLIFRVLEAIGATMIIVTSLSIITDVLPDDKSGRGKALFFVFVYLGGVVGNLIGGFILEEFTYNVIFWVNLPLGILTLIFALFKLPYDNICNPNKTNYLGLFLMGCSIVSLYFYVVYGQNDGYFTLIELFFLLSFLIFLILFLVLQTKTKNPIIDYHIIANPELFTNLLCLFMMYATVYIYYMSAPFYLQYSLGLSLYLEGIVLMVFPLVIVLSLMITGYLCDRFGTHKLITAGMIIYFIAFVGLSKLSLDTSINYFVGYSIILGIGYACFLPANNVNIMHLATSSTLTRVSGIKTLFQYLGNYIGIIGATSFLYIYMSAYSGKQVTSYVMDEPEVFIYGMQKIYQIGNIIIFLILIVYLTWWLSTTLIKEKRKKL